MFLALIMSLLLSSTGTIEIDTQLLDKLVKKTYPKGLRVFPTLFMTDLKITQIKQNIIKGQGTIHWNVDFSIPQQVLSFGVFPKKIKWDLILPIKFSCNLKVKGAFVVVPIKSVSFSIIKGMKISMSVFDAFEKLWNRFISQNKIFYIKILNLNTIFLPYFGKGPWEYALILNENQMILKIKRR